MASNLLFIKRGYAPFGEHSIKMKVVIIGDGKIGSSLSALLVQEGHDVTVVDNKTEALKKSLNSQDVMCVEGNGATVEVQLEAGVNKAGLLIATTHYDELNMLCCMTAKKLGAKKTISRVRNPEYYKQIDLIRDDMGLSMVINPELTAANEITRVIIFPTAAKVEIFEKGRVELVEHKLSDSSPLNGLSLAEIYKRLNIKFLICAVQRESGIYIPSGDFILHSGDRINIAASHSDIEKFFRQSGALKNRIKTVLIVGGGRIGFYLAKQLLNIGMRVKIIDKSYDRCTMLCDLLPKATIINGDGTDQELLQEEGISDVDAFIALSGIDEENIIMSLYAKNNSDAKVVTKINRDTYIDMASMLGLDCVVSPKNLTTSEILTYVRSLSNTAENSIESLYHIIGKRVEAIEFSVKEKIPELTGIPLRELKLKKDILICAIIRKRQIIIPNGNDTIELDDSVVIVTKEHRFSDLKDIVD